MYFYGWNAIRNENKYEWCDTDRDKKNAEYLNAGKKKNASLRFHPGTSPHLDSSLINLSSRY